MNSPAALVTQSVGRLATLEAPHRSGRGERVCAGDEEGVMKGRASSDRTGREIRGRVAAFQSAA